MRKFKQMHDTSVDGCHGDKAEWVEVQGQAKVTWSWQKEGGRLPYGRITAFKRDGGENVPGLLWYLAGCMYKLDFVE